MAHLVSTHKAGHNYDLMPSDYNIKYQRYALIDAVRGMAILMMFVYHFSWDLNNFKFLTIDFYHTPFWLNFRTVIVTTFLSVMGVSLYLTQQKGMNKQSFLKRLYWLSGSALLITVITLISNGERYIYFGILHFIAIASVLALPLLRFYWINLMLGILIILLGLSYQDPLFNPRYLNWIGFVSEKPVTDDYVPIFPWLGVVLIGIFVGRWAYSEQKFKFIKTWHGNFPLVRLLRYAGQHSLLIYMVHQPIFIGILYVIQQQIR